MKILIDEAKRINSELAGNRRYLHRHPELSLSLPVTKKYVIQKLREYGYEPKEYGESGVVVTVGGKEGKVFLLRGDMDALPIQEETGLPYASEHEGCMHACGHDCHTAMLLGAAKLLKEHEDEIEGTVKLLFQPGEEPLLGAKEMVNAGVLENPSVDAAMMLHTMIGTPIPDGMVGVFGGGPAYASSDWFKINVKGKGGHGAAPQLSVDPLAAVCAIYSGIQEIVAGHVNPAENCVMTIGEIHGGSTGNIIPDTAYMRGTIRTFNENTRNTLKESLVRMVENTAKARRCEAAVDFTNSCGVAECSSQVSEDVLAFTQELLGNENAADLRTAFGGALRRLSGSEDFAAISEKVPSSIALLFMGNTQAGYKYGNHHPKSRFNDDFLYVGAAVYANTAIEWLKKNK
ncbi:M20 family metallopeptidase [Clostridium sp. AN503]|uniref:M20 metallopeptidase family protein n=1 Tax=Clostridium sp. AN503 TaxID=3160598 RepID=UPI0034589A73